MYKRWKDAHYSGQANDRWFCSAEAESLCYLLVQICWLSLIDNSVKDFEYPIQIVGIGSDIV
ncbi:hypothetical protein [Pseudomonas sp. 24 E 13]|nr:hypothetical protein [Pseudomonas sp. 24 E 13]